MIMVMTVVVASIGGGDEADDAAADDDDIHTEDGDHFLYQACGTLSV